MAPLFNVLLAVYVFTVPLPVGSCYYCSTTFDVT